MSRFSRPRDAARAILAPNTHPYGLWSLCCSFYSRPSFAAEIQLLWVHQTQQHHPPGKHFWKKSAGGGVAARCQRQHGATEHPLSPPTRRSAASAIPQPPLTPPELSRPRGRAGLGSSRGDARGGARRWRWGRPERLRHRTERTALW